VESKTVKMVVKDLLSADNQRRDLLQKLNYSKFSVTIFKLSLPWQ